MSESELVVGSIQTIDALGILGHSRSCYGRLLLDLILVQMGLLLRDDSSVCSHCGLQCLLLLLLVLVKVVVG